MSASKYCKDNGLKSVKELSAISGFSEWALFNYWNNDIKRFKCLVAGASSIKNQGGN